MTAALPPVEPLHEVASILRRAGVGFALGGSGLLAALGLAERVGDWDLTTDADPAVIRRIFAECPHERFGPSGIHADHKLRVHSGAVEVIVGMAVRSGGAVCRIPTLPRGEWRGVPLASPEAWAVAYALLGRPGKADLLFAHLQRAGADPSAVARMLQEPLPGPLAERLRGLPAACIP